MLRQREEYARYYGDFRGVDFSTDHTLVLDNRFPYAVNMYKDYFAGSGQGIETIPGYRFRIAPRLHDKVFGIHAFKSPAGDTKVLIHTGKYLFSWDGYGNKDEKGEESESGCTRLFSDMNLHDSVSFIFNNRLYIMDGGNYLVYDGETATPVKNSAYIPTTYINIMPTGENANNGTEYEQRNMLSPYFKHTFIADGENKVFKMNESGLDGIVSVKVYGTVQEVSAYTVDKANGTVTFNEGVEAPKKPEDAGYPEFYAGIEITAEKAVYDVKDVKIKRADGTVTTLAAYKDIPAEGFVSMVESATIATTFDNRVFFSGIPGKPNLILFCGRNDTGMVDPSYIGILNYMEDGVGNTPITAMLGVAGTLLVLKNDTQQDGSVYYHTPMETGEDILPKVYPSEAGLAGTGCLGAAINFLDDPVFISRLGLDAIGQLSVRYERAREHRSSMVDAKLINGKNVSPFSFMTIGDLASAKLCEWGGYLWVLVGDKVFLADSRQRFQNAAGDLEYEWYYLEGLGTYDTKEDKYYYLEKYPEMLVQKDGIRVDLEGYNGMPCKVITDLPENERPTEAPYYTSVSKDKRDFYINDTKITINYGYVIHDMSNGETVSLLVDTLGEKEGLGKYDPACYITVIDDNVFFGTANGRVFSFNFDKRNDEGLIEKKWYTFDGLTIFSGCALKMDNCGTPNMVKSTSKKTTVIKTKNLYSSGAKIRVRTNKNPYKEIAQINSKRFSFSDMDFSDFTFAMDGETLFAVTEKEKKWVEKQYFIYSDEYEKPFALFYLIYRYAVIGKYKG